MNTRLNAVLFSLMVAALTMLLIVRVAADDSLTAARDLYATAAYDDALTMLNRLHGADYSSEDRRAIGLYRTLCLLALNRQTDAEHAIESMVAEFPAYRPADAEMPPRVRLAFRDVRRRTLPGIIQQKYAEAKKAFDRQDFAVAAETFGQALDALNDPDLGPAANQPPLADLRTLAVGFRDLSAKAAPPPPPPAPATAAAEPPRARPVNRVYTTEDAGVVAPTVVRQQLPPFPTRTRTARNGVIEVVIDETGSVESATMRVPIAAPYDSMVLSAAKAWRYRPATVNGTPVRFRRLVQITVQPNL